MVSALLASPCKSQNWSGRVNYCAEYSARTTFLAVSNLVHPHIIRKYCTNFSIIFPWLTLKILSLNLFAVVLISAINNVNDLIYIDGDIKVVELVILLKTKFVCSHAYLYFPVERILRSWTIWKKSYDLPHGISSLHESSELSVVSPKYCHSLETQNHVIFNSSQIFETHPATSPLKLILTP